MDVGMLNFVMKILWCDVKHSFRGYSLFFMLVAMVMAALPPDNTNVLCFSWFIVIAMNKFMPTCDRILFILPIDAEDRKKFMIYRQIVVEIFSVILLFGIALAKYMVYGNTYRIQSCLINNVMMIALMFFEMGSTVCFCEWYKEASTKEKGFGIFFAIIAWVAFATAIIMSAIDTENRIYNIALLLGVGGVAVQALVKLYYMVHAEFTEYKIVNVNDSINGASGKKTNMADERF